MVGEDENKLRELLIKATRDLNFREEFLKDPVSIGKKYGVSFTKEQLSRIDQTSKLMMSVREIIDRRIIPPFPDPGYPIGPILGRWEMDELHALVRHPGFGGPIYYPMRPPGGTIFYPIPPHLPGYPIPPQVYPIPPYFRRRVIR